MKKKFFTIFKVLLVLYILICGFLFMLQENFIFFPQKLSKNHPFKFADKFKEINIRAPDSVLLNTILFEAENSKGVIYYLHGNAGSLDSWGTVAKTYTDLNYDVLMLDYRGYGKSGGSISSEKQLFGDVQLVYDELKKMYSEDRIVVLGYSIGTGPASKLAADNNPRLLILQAPYYSLTDMMKHFYPVIPAFVLKYKFETYKYIQSCKMPVIIFHGDCDEVVYYGSALKLKQHLKETDRLITLEGEGHNGMTDCPEYKIEIQKILNGN